ncbi:MAG: sensor histidine kinase, partial [Clostridia bacterium]
GPAITDADIQRINEEMEKDDIRENTSIGMSNVNRRIKLHFGTQYGLSVSHTAAGYTCVTVSFPLGTIKEDE